MGAVHIILYMTTLAVPRVLKRLLLLLAISCLIEFCLHKSMTNTVQWACPTVSLTANHL
jgi:hypothetical protein